MNQDRRLSNKIDGWTTVALGHNVRRIRQERQLSLGALAREAGLAKQTLANLEGGRGNPTVETLIAVARALGIGVNWLLTEWDSPVLVQRQADAEWVSEAAGRRRTLDQIHGTGQVVTAIVELTAAREVRPALPPGALHHAYVLRGVLQAGPVEDPHTRTPWRPAASSGSRATCRTSCGPRRAGTPWRTW